mmetsp:Transcript_42570/g.48058  ORF Transcript_42570/g.48058 Transcript_42570/m.48058 type:complete len:84 (+) Transcript_42570:332-583(+)
MTTCTTTAAESSRSSSSIVGIRVIAVTNIASILYSLTFPIRLLLFSFLPYRIYGTLPAVLTFCCSLTHSLALSLLLWSDECGY